MHSSQLFTEFLKLKSVTTDTRNIPNQSIFFALKGENFNGNKFALEALEKGASWAVVDEDLEFNDDRILKVNNVLETLQQLAKTYREHLKIPFIGLTGSNGKTTSKELIAAVLQQKFKVHYTFGNLNNHIGVPLTILGIKDVAEIAVIEMGANHQKEIEFLASIAQPDYGYITNFGHAHLEGFGGFEGVIKGKSELYDYLRNNSKKVLVNFDDAIQVEQSKNMDQITFSKTKTADYQIELLTSNDALLKVKFENEEIQSHLTGDYNWSNLAAAISFGKIFGLTISDIKTGIENYIPSNHRSQLIQKENYTILMDAYNANPSSMEASLNNFKKLEGTKTVILGDMFELGDESHQNHQKIAQLAIDNGMDNIYLIGKNFNQININSPKIFKFLDRNALTKYLNEHPIKTRNILIKGSHGMRLDLLESGL